jgi:hypothetical protein
MGKYVPMIALGIVLSVALGCDHAERISKLEKQTEELKAETKRNQAATEYDLATKCSRDGKAWFRENFPPDKDTITLTYTNHYNKSQNKCFLLVEWHYNLSKSGSWTNHMSLWDINENVQYADFSQSHIVLTIPQYHVEDDPVHCSTNVKNCATQVDFNNFVAALLND